MHYKILCSDLDGTLLSSKSDVSEFAIAEIGRIKEHLKVILVSARMPQAMHYVQQDLRISHWPIICYNGALVLDGEKVIASTTIDFEVVNAIHKLAEEHQIKLGLYHNREWYVEETSERVQKEIKYTKTEATFRSTKATLTDWKQRQISAHKIMLMGTKSSSDAIYPLLQRNFYNQMQVYRSNDTLIELAPNSVSKLTAIKLLLTSDESLDDVISFGDNYNDIEMLQHTGLGVAVGNAREEVKAIANHTTLKNTEDGVAQFIKEHLVI